MANERLPQRSIPDGSPGHRINRSCRLAPAHQGMKIRVHWLVGEFRHCHNPHLPSIPALPLNYLKLAIRERYFVEIWDMRSESGMS